MKLLIIFLFLTGCASIPQVQNPSDIGAGAVIGAGATKAIEKAQETLTPKFPLYFSPVEICDISQEDKVTCVAVPCSEGVCSVIYSKKEWLSANLHVLTVRQSLLVPVTKYCLKNPDSCIKQSAKYEGKTFVVVED